MTQTHILLLLCSQSPQSWQTTVGLPFFQIQGTVVEWDEYAPPRIPLTLND
jgi:hypothetical protein